MKKFLTYFDFLGYKKFIENNNSEHVEKRVNNILRDIEMVLGQGNITETNYGVVANLDNSRINCLNISDTVIFWTNDNTKESFEELLKVSFDFNWRLNCYNFPVRGAMFFDEIEVIYGFYKTKADGTYNVNSIFGKGLVRAHLKAENLNFAGCVIDNSVIEKIGEFGEVEGILNQYSLLYEIPYTDGTKLKPEYAFTFWENKGKTNKIAIENRGTAIEKVFNDDNKGMNERAEIILKNTLDFLNAMK